MSGIGKSWNRIVSRTSKSWNRINELVEQADRGMGLMSQWNRQIVEWDTGDQRFSGTVRPHACDAK